MIIGTWRRSRWNTIGNNNITILTILTILTITTIYNDNRYLEMVAVEYNW